MRPDFEKCVAAIADTIVRSDVPNFNNLASIGAVTQFLLKTHANMPDYLRIAFRILTLIFDAWPLATSGVTFHALDVASRSHQILSWKKSRLRPCSGLMTFYGSLTVFSFYSELYRQDFEVGAKSDHGGSCRALVVS
ncbi:MAG: hypothetical protein ABJA10_09865 [Aestuariivirga sp.]